MSDHDDHASPAEWRSGGVIGPIPGGWDGAWWCCPVAGCPYGERGIPGDGPLGSGICADHNAALVAGPPPDRSVAES